MTQDLIIHPTASTPIPRTLIEAGRSGKAKVKAKPRDMTRDDLAALIQAKGLKALTAHTKAELRAMLVLGKQLRPAAYDRNNAARKAKRAQKAK